MSRGFEAESVTIRVATVKAEGTLTRSRLLEVDEHSHTATRDGAERGVTLLQGVNRPLALFISGRSRLKNRQMGEHLQVHRMQVDFHGIVRHRASFASHACRGRGQSLMTPARAVKRAEVRVPAARGG